MSPLQAEESSGDDASDGAADGSNSTAAPSEYAPSINTEVAAPDVAVMVTCHDIASLHSSLVVFMLVRHVAEWQRVIADCLRSPRTRRRGGPSEVGADLYRDPVAGPRLGEPCAQSSG